MSNILKTLAAGSASEPTDEYFNQTTLLLHGDGTNGAQNNTFLDSSTNNFTITRNGNTTQGTFSPFSADEGKWSNFFPAGTDYLTTTTSNTGIAGEFTIEFWMYLTAATGTDFVTVWNNSRWIQFANGYKLYATLAGFSGLDIGGLNKDEWVHICITRDASNNTYAFKNGELKGTSTSTLTFWNSTFRIGQYSDTTRTFGGYLSNLRVVDGTCLHTTSFTPDTSPLTAISGTVLLACQGNRFVDASGTHTIATAGVPSVQPFSPFAPSAAYSPSVNGGSGYWDGSDTLTVSSSGLTFAGDFTVEAWIYSPFQGGTGASGFTIIDTRAGYTLTNWAIGVFDSAGTVYWVSTGTAPTSSIACVPNAWNHVLVSRSGTTLRIFVNGQQGYAGTISGTLTPGSATAYIGTGNAGSAYTGPGYISGLSVINGTATQTSNFTPPTAPPSPTGSSLCLLMQNAGIFDNTGKNNLETVGNAQIDTATKKYGTGSMEFDGTGDYLFAPASSLFDCTSGEYTIEFWVNFSVYSGSGVYVLFGFNGKATTGSWHILLSSGVLYFQQRGSGTNQISYSWTPSTGTWYHIAVSRDTTTRLFIDGVVVGSNANNPPASPAQNGVNIGGASDGYYINGLIDDLRITKGVARYTTTFTPPTAPFPDQ